jgi:hypothetical protein
MMEVGSMERRVDMVSIHHILTQQILNVINIPETIWMDFHMDMVWSI